MDKLIMRKMAEGSNSSPRESFEFLEQGMARLRVNRRKVYYFTAFATAATLVFLLFSSNEYTASTRFFAQNNTMQDRLSSLVSSIAPMGLSLASKLTSMKSEGATLRGLFTSNRFLDAVLKREYESGDNHTSQSLYELLNQPHKEYARMELQDRIYFNENIKSGMITLSVVTNDPLLTANLADACFEELDKIKREMEKQSIAEEIVFYTSQIKSAKENLKLTVDSQSEFLSKNRNYLIGDDPILRQKVAEHETSVLYHANVLVGLKKMATAAEFAFNRDISHLKLIEKADVPLLKSGPPRLMYLLMSIIGSFLFCVGVIFLINAYRWYFPANTRKEIQDTVTVVRSDVISILGRAKSRNQSFEKISS